ncbi:hypothetical protein Syun_028966 [Stephania yunnanensis]|uniref:Kinesin motor domain-containing protein n=1 Tax=Stephania yunnanensis TaxID=152371 RepID=A0AAP0E827_9MAGN
MLVLGEDQISSMPTVEKLTEEVAMASSPDSFDGLPMASPESPSSTLVSFTDVKVVPEQQQKGLEQTILHLEGEVIGLRLKKRSLDAKRREALNKILDIKGSIRVFCRVRPFLITDKRRNQEPICVRSEKLAVSFGGSKKEFGFDKVFPQNASQEDVFMEVEPILRSALDGHNVCIMAYGQTGTGKTFTMEGTNNLPGIVPRTLKELFDQASMDSSNEFTFSLSMLEVYMGSVRDLLAPKPSNRIHHGSSKCNLNIQTDPNGCVEIEGLTNVSVSDFTQASRWYNKGKRARSTSWTNVNESSSRSHCLTRITVGRSGGTEEAMEEFSKLWLVDLGGSERLLKTGATGQTLDEGKAINLSLSALGDVIAALKRKRGHIPYRNSKLTQILRDSLGDDSKALMLVHVSPSEEDSGETTCSLNFAKRVRAIESNKELPEDLKKQRERRISELEEVMRDAEEECQKVRNQIQKAELILHETKKLFKARYRRLQDNDNIIPVKPQECKKELTGMPQTAEKPSQRNSSSSLPRFMTSTAASRHRHGAVEEEISSRVKPLRPLHRVSFQFSGSQSISYSDTHFRTSLQGSIKKPRHGDANEPMRDTTNCNGLDPKTPSMPGNKRVTTSYSNLKVALPRHRRRMSDLI